MRITLFSFIFAAFFTNISQAGDNCWDREINARTLQIYSSPGEWENDHNNWRQKLSWVNPFQLYRAYRVYDNEKNKAKNMGSDKVGHCYMGCRIAQKTDLRTVKYIAWYKEEMDLTDCDPSTHFEEADYAATIRGGSFRMNDADACERQCKMGPQ